MGSIWRLANVDQFEFAALATVLAVKAKQSSLSASGGSDLDRGDDSDSEDDGVEDSATSRPTARLTTHSRDALVDKFLDRLAELFSRKKSSPQQRHRQDSNHVASTAWITPNSVEKSALSVLFAKNGGPDERDRELSHRLQLWFRAIAASGRAPPIYTDKIWNEESGLVAYSRNRLLYHISQVKESGRMMDALAEQSAIYGPVVNCLQCLCQNATPSATIQQLSDIVNVAHILRSASKYLRRFIHHTKAYRTINMLGRLRAIYECFKTVALTFPEVSDIEITPATLLQPLTLNTNRFRKRVQELAHKYTLPKACLKHNAYRRYMNAQELHVHAEMQILVSLAKDPQWFKRSHRYIGISKKPCFLCNQILRNYSPLSMEGPRQHTFRMRSSHEKVYPLWTLPDDEIGSLNARMALGTALTCTYHDICRRLQHNLVLQAPIAESSAGVTHAASISTGIAAARTQHLATQRSLSSTVTTIRDETTVSFGRKLKSVKVGRLPEDGSAPTLTRIKFYEQPDEADRRLREGAHALIPDFHKFWGVHQFDRRYRLYCLQEQAVSELDGDYRIYWNEDPELAENNYIKGLLGIQGVESYRRFWYGDAFVVRYTEDSKTFTHDVHDAPAAILESPHLQTFFQHMWDEEFLERELEQDRYGDARQEKIEADKEIIFQRM